MSDESDRSPFAGRSVLVCVTGGIAAYKAAALVSELVQLDIRVRVVMSAGARRFIQPLTFQAITAERVVTDLFDPDHAGVQHVQLAAAHDLVVVAPAPPTPSPGWPAARPTMWSQRPSWPARLRCWWRRRWKAPCGTSRPPGATWRSSPPTA